MYLDLLQKINDILYKTFGASDMVINFQTYINKKRYEQNKLDENEIITYDDGKPFVQ